ncbi:MAG: pyridoxine 5'-phosphate synthase [Deltaproteobacteria bacterium]|nr:pyridoxine 5'-phosphate synthase [Deltaproteobacteria bacterium]
MTRRLGFNVDHVATLRQARRACYPDPLAAALIAELAGAAQITCHVRGDRRHVQDRDLERLRDSVQTLLNVEMAPTSEMRQIAVRVRPHRVTLVPEREGEVTTEGGLDVAGQRAVVADFAAALREAGVRVSLFVDPVPGQVEACRMEGVDMLELNTDRYAVQGGPAEIRRLVEAARLAASLGLEVAAGHGLNHHNLPDLVAAVPSVVEYNIGHSIVARAVFVGLERAVRDILAILEQAG